VQDLPAQELARITGDWQSAWFARGEPPTVFTSEGIALGRTSESSGTVIFRAKIHNGSNWTVTDLTFEVIAKEKDGVARWARQVNMPFMDCHILMPTAADEFSVSVPDADGIGSSEWSIVKARGYKLE